MIGAILRAAADLVDPQPKLVPPVTETAYLADLDEARTEASLLTLSDLPSARLIREWLDK